MLKLNELRIGNYIQDARNRPQKITPSLMMAIIETTISLIQPIPLTDEWLKKFGFEICREIGGWEAKMNGVFLWRGEDWNYWTYSTVDVSCNEIDIVLKYVHQLQNLYFVLKENELEKQK